MAAIALLACGAGGCERDLAGLGSFQFTTDPVVIDDTFGDSVDYQAFLFSKLDAISIDTNSSAVGNASLKIMVPDPGSFAGGAFVAGFPRNLTDYNALTFFAKASEATAFDVVGLGNDNTGNSKFEASSEGYNLTTQWQKYVLPIPLAQKLAAERGLFFFADATEGAAGVTVWFDEVRYEKIPTITNPRPVLVTQNVGSFIGATVDVVTQVTFNVNGNDRLVNHLPGYFTFTSSDESVVSTAGNRLTVVGAGNAEISAKLGGVPATGMVTVNAVAPPPVPAPTPTVPAANVISLFSNAYNNFAVFAWFFFGQATVTDLKVAGNDVKAYTNLTFAGIQFKEPPPPPPPADEVPQLDASDLTHFHMDIWVPDAVVFRIKLVDFGEDGRFGLAPDSESELTFTPLTTPPIVNGQWISFDIPLSDFTGLVSRAHLAQLIISIVGSEPTVFIDNVYFYK